MSREMIVQALTAFISKEILDGEDIGLEETTPLMEWGIINSMETARLVAFIETQFGVQLPSDKITLEHFKNLGALSTLVVQQQQP